MKDADAEWAPARILVVTDAPASAKLLADLLVSQRQGALAVGSGAEALGITNPQTARRRADEVIE
jgi:CheY-like chemotaxis protein